MFDPSGLAIPSVATFFSIWADSVVNSCDIYTYFQPSGGSIAPLGAPQPLSGVGPGSGLPQRYDWPLPGGTGTAYANMVAHSGYSTATLTYRGGYGYPDGTSYCAGGVQLQTGAQLLYYLTPGLIDVWLAEVGMEWLAPFFTAFWFTSLDANKLCSALPPPTPGTLSANPDSVSPGSLYDLLRAIAWQNVCQCTSGVSPSVPGTSEPTGVVSLPTTTCSNTDPCATLTDIWQDLANTQKVVNQIYRLLAEPILTPSTVHAGLTGIGTLTVSAIHGFSISFTAAPALYGTQFATPTNKWGIAKISWSDPNGVIDEAWVGDTHRFIIPYTATQIGYALQSGVVATITELL